MMHTPKRLGAVKIVLLEQLGGGDVVTLALVCASPEAATGVHQAIAERLQFDNYDFRAIAEVEYLDPFKPGAPVFCTVYDFDEGAIEIPATVVRRSLLPTTGQVWVRFENNDRGEGREHCFYERDLAIRAEA